MIVLDTNVVSETIKPKPNPHVMSWLERQELSDVHVSGPGLMEQSYGAERYLRKTGSRRYLDFLAQVMDVDFHGRILEFLDPAPVVAGRIRAERERIGRPINVQDAMIAAICLVHGAALATRNVRDFEDLGLTLVNPFEPVG